MRAESNSSNGSAKSNSPTLHSPENFTKADHKHPGWIMRDNGFNKGTAFSGNERDTLNLRGLLPARVTTIDEQTSFALNQLKKFPEPINKYIYLESLKARNETVFYNLLINNMELCTPIVYTPTVGEACKKFGQIFRSAQGMYFTKDDKGHMRTMLDNWIHDDVSIIVVTDGSRILGLGDLGANGMGIPIGKLSLYVAAGGFHPMSTLPIMLDFGTNTESYMTDPCYLGMQHKRIPDDEYYTLVDEFMSAIKDKWPQALLQFEDFSNNHCFKLLELYKDQQLCFNDDIQGTGAVIAGGFINAAKLSGIPAKEHKFAFFGAGSAGIGVADQIVSVLMSHGLTIEQARNRFWFVDSKGLVTKTRGDKLASHKVAYARTDAKKELKTLEEVVREIKPTALIGLSGQGGKFTEKILRLMAENCKNPIVFPLSNPTTKAECTAEQAYTYTDGKCIFASGSPFDPVEFKGKTHFPGQGNNMYIFPGLGFGAWLCEADRVSNKMIVNAALALAESVTDEELARGQVYPSISRIRDIEAQIATRVIETAIEENLAQKTDFGGDIKAYCESSMYQPQYISSLPKL